MKRRAVFVLFCLTPFMLAILVAPLRPLLRDQLLGSYHIPLARWPWTAWIYGDEAASRQREIARLEAAARQSNDAALQIKLGEWQADDNTPSYGESRARADEKLLPRYPKVAWLAADYLRFDCMTALMFGTRHREVPEMSPPMINGNVDSVFPFDNWQRVVGVAQRGRELEPNNTYFDWMLMHGLLELYRDAEALQILHEAAQKTAYDDHINDDTRAHLKALEAANGPQALETRFTVAGAQLYPHLAMMRNISRILGWFGRRAQHAGDHRQALAIYADLAQLTAVLSRNPNELNRRCGASMQIGAWHSCGMGLSAEIPARVEVKPEIKALRDGKRFADYAQAHGSADLSAATLDTAKRNAAFWRTVRDDYFQDDFLGVPMRHLSLIFGMGKMGCIMVAQTALLLTCLMLLWLLSGLARAWRIWKRVAAPNSTAHTLQRRDVLALFGFSGLLHALVVSTAVYWLPDSEKWPGQWMFCDNIVDFPHEILGVLLALALQPLFVAPLVVGVAMVWRVWRWHKQNPAERTTLQRRLAAMAEWRLLPLSSTWGLFAAACVAWGLLFWAKASGQSSFDFGFPFLDNDPQFSIPIGTSWPAWLFSALWLLPLVMRCWHHAAQPTPWRGYGALWLRRIWALHLALTCWTWFLLLVLSLPARHAADAQFEEFVRRPDLRGAGHAATLP